jgi:uncharacterized protein
MGTGTSDRVSRLLFGSVRREVLVLLMGRADEQFYLREILRAVGGGSGAVQRELKQLTDAGLVRREVRGNHVYFSANTDAAIFPELQAIVQKTAGTVDIVRASLGPLVRERQIDVALVYGSVASGKQTSRSDVDLLIVGDITLEEVIPALRKAEARLGRDVNPSLFSPKEFRDKLKRGSAFLKRVSAGPKLFVVGDDRDLGRLAR